MDPYTLVDNEEYQGKYVALRSFSDNTVLSSGDKPEKVMDAARETGAEEPVIIYVPKRDMTYIY